jgi:aminoglycoside phosphotransferase (APT) family kinase protein
MLAPERPLEQISIGLLDHLQAALNNPRLAYAEPLTQLQGGYETCTYRFALRGAGPPWTEPLILRLYPARFGAANAAWESAVQNLLADAGYPVARAHLTCTDPSVLGGVFYVMQFLPGEPMINVGASSAPPISGAALAAIPVLLGETHAALHDLDPAPLLASLEEQGFDERRYRLAGRMEGLQHRARPHPWLHGAVDWLVDHCPPEPARLSICHGDFHPLNLLVQDGRVTGVLDWPGFMIADPVSDVATTTVLVEISGKHVLGAEGMQAFVRLYLDAYETCRPLDRTRLETFRARRCITALLEGAEGHPVWQQPAIVADLVACARDVTGLRLEPGG